VAAATRARRAAGTTAVAVATIAAAVGIAVAAPTIAVAAATIAVADGALAPRHLRRIGISTTKFLSKTQRTCVLHRIVTSSRSPTW
jgi:hypothetical protein